jgi:hypothetical protein
MVYVNSSARGKCRAKMKPNLEAVGGERVYEQLDADIGHHLR